MVMTAIACARFLKEWQNLGRTFMATSEIYTDILKAPFGELFISATDAHLVSVSFVKQVPVKPNQLTGEAKVQLHAYINGTKKDFNLPLKLEGTEFQKSVWNELSKIPFGVSISYLELAKRLGNEKVIRAAANANGKNPIPIIIPCHRVIGSDKSLIGFSGGIENKRWLLTHERIINPDLFSQ
jgi:methylated-DNA-[protein]-cysteine S-methyltransferase